MVIITIGTILLYYVPWCYLSNSVWSDTCIEQYGPSINVEGSVWSDTCIEL